MVVLPLVSTTDKSEFASVNIEEKADDWNKYLLRFHGLGGGRPMARRSKQLARPGRVAEESFLLGVDPELIKKRGGATKYNARGARN